MSTSLRARRRAALLTPVGTTIAVAGPAVATTAPPSMTGHGCQASIRFEVALNERRLAQFQSAPGRCLIVFQVRKWRHSASKSETWPDSGSLTLFLSPSCRRPPSRLPLEMNGCTGYRE
jgi:hypothetical protein